RPDHQLPPAAVDAAGAGGGLRRTGTPPRALFGGRGARLPFLLLRRRDAAHVSEPRENDPTKDTRRAAQLRREIAHHDWRYHVLDQPEIADVEHDRLRRQLQEIEARRPELVPPDSPTQRVSGRPRAGSATVAHDPPLLSLDNSFDEAELREWHARLLSHLGVEELPG